MEKNSLPLDIDHELKEFNNDVKFFKGLIDDFIMHAEQTISVMEKALADNDTEALRRAAHAIKGGAANLTANYLSKTASELEDICKSGDLKQSSKSIGQLKNELFRLKEYIQNHDSLKL